MKSMTMPIFEPGDVFAVGDGSTMEFYRVTNERVVEAFEPTTLSTAIRPEEGIESLNLSVRAYNVLKRQNINTIQDLLDFWKAHGKEGLADLRNIGVKATEEIVGKIQELTP